MFVSLTLATLAFLMGSQYSPKIKEIEKKDEDVAPPDDLYKRISIPLIERELEAYGDICKSVSKDKSINSLNRRRHTILS